MKKLNINLVALEKELEIVESRHTNFKERCEATKEWSIEKMNELNIMKWLGSEYDKYLFYIFEQRSDYDLLMMIAPYDEQLEARRLLSMEDAKIRIKETKERLERIAQCYYICVRFKTSIKEHYYAGDQFIGIKEGMTAEEGENILHSLIEDKKAEFFPALQAQIESFMPNWYQSDYYEFGSDDFGLYWDIPKEDMQHFQKKLFAWIRYEELEGHFLSLYTDGTRFGEHRRTIDLQGNDMVLHSDGINMYKTLSGNRIFHVTSNSGVSEFIWSDNKHLACFMIRSLIVENAIKAMGDKVAWWNRIKYYLYNLRDAMSYKAVEFQVILFREVPVGECFIVNGGFYKKKNTELAFSPLLPEQCLKVPRNTPCMLSKKRLEQLGFTKDDFLELEIKG